MSNLKDEFAWHGSKLLIQMFVNNERKKMQLDKLIGLGEIKWFSPLSIENFKEYKLIDFFNMHDEFNIQNLNITELSKIKSQWDAIGISPDGTLILVEAKAHLDEMEDNEDNINKRKASRDFPIISRLISSTMGNDPIWVEKYYQLANRYTYLDNLNNAGIKTKLVYIYFVNDVSYVKTSRDEWIKYIASIYENHPVSIKLEENTIHIYYDMWNENNN